MGDILSTAGDVSSILAALEKARADGRVTEANTTANYGRAQADIYNTAANMALKGPKESAQNVALGDTLSNIQPFQWTGGTQLSGNIPIPQSSGGLGPQNFGPATRQAGADLARVAGARVASPSFNMPTAPVLPQMPSSNTLDSILGSASTLGSLASALGKAGSGAGGDIGKLVQLLRGRKGNTNGNTGQPIGDFTNNLDNPPDPPATGDKPLTPNVSTSETFTLPTENNFDWEQWMKDQENGGASNGSPWPNDTWSDWGG